MIIAAFLAKAAHVRRFKRNEAHQAPRTYRFK